VTSKNELKIDESLLKLMIHGDLELSHKSGWAKVKECVSSLGRLIKMKTTNMAILK